MKLLSNHKLRYNSSVEEDDFEVPGWERNVSRIVAEYIDVLGSEAGEDNWSRIELKGERRLLSLVQLFQVQYYLPLTRPRLAFSSSTWPRVLVAVHSAPENAEKREVIRRNHGRICAEGFEGEEDRCCVSE